MAVLVLRLVKGSPLTNQEVDTNFSNLNSDISLTNANVGVMTALTTVNRSNIVFAVNELKSNIGIITDLTTATKSNLVAAANELRTTLFGNILSNVGVLSALTTTNKSNIVFAVNELRSNIGIVSNLTTDVKANLVAAVNELDANTVQRTRATGSAILPSGTFAQRDASPQAGFIRFNTTDVRFEGYNGTLWTGVGGGATGGGSDEIFVLNSNTVTTSYTIPAGKNASSTGPITINSGITVTISSGSRWVVL